MGVRVAAAGDVNGDGYADFIVGAYTYGLTITRRGRVYVYYGSPTGPGSPLILDGNQDFAEFGYCVAGIGDVNGDGFSDVAVSARRYNNGHTDAGRIYVYYGSPTGLISSPVWTADGDQDSCEFGYRVASVGDVNGDGFSDVVVGAPFYDRGQRNEGAAFVYYGSKTGLGPNGTPANAGWSAEG